MRTISRRLFLKQTGGALVALPCFVPGNVLGKDRSVPASERIRVGFIGVRNRGEDLFHAFLGFEEITSVRTDGQLTLRRAESDLYADAQAVAVADVDGEVRDTCLATYEKRYGRRCDAYADFRRLLDRKDIDAVCIATPDHWHAIPVVMACQAGKDIYCEKPLSYTIGEGRAMADAARRYQRVFQTGSQQRSCAGFRIACELVRNGRLGKIHRIEAGLGGSPSRGGAPDTEAPPTLDWNFWLGPAPWRAYNPYLHKMPHRGWRWMWDYSGGILTNWGPHHLDIAQWAMGTDNTGPVEVEGQGTAPDEGLCQTYFRYHVVYRYATGVTVDCSNRHPTGVKFYGEKGTGFVTRDGSLGDRVHVRSKGIACDPPELADATPGPSDVRLYVSDNHLRNWLDCIKNRRPCVCDAEIGHRSATLAHLGNIAIRLGRTLRWDPVEERFPDDAEANQRIERSYRAPWQLKA